MLDDSFTSLRLDDCGDVSVYRWARTGTRAFGPESSIWYQILYYGRFTCCILFLWSLSLVLSSCRTCITAVCIE